MDAVNARQPDAPLRLSIGLAIGPAYVGPIREGRRRHYAAIGPAVDIAGWLRRQSERYGPAIICDDAAFRETNHRFAFLELDRLPTDAGERPIFALVGNPFLKSSKRFRALDEAHRAMLSAYRRGDRDAAAAALATVRKSPGAAIALFDLYEERINAMAASTPVGIGPDISARDDQARDAHETDAPDTA